MSDNWLLFPVTLARAPFLALCGGCHHGWPGWPGVEERAWEDPATEASGLGERLGRGAQEAVLGPWHAEVLNRVLGASRPGEGPEEEGRVPSPESQPRL